MCNMHKHQNIEIHIVYLDIGVRDSPARGISSQGAIGQGLGGFPGLFAFRRVHFLVDSSDVHNVTMVFMYLQCFGQEFSEIVIIFRNQKRPLPACLRGRCWALYIRVPNIGPQICPTSMRDGGGGKTFPEIPSRKEF